ncbi:hypothetical protein FISHEDRAFT_76981 [Fistulina hepatica ATCC 64428]|uniref:Uncharacterized protein n=1 Tax=Fistulina hepatica ATCC 64428 TaxID=1128425 RepID=A0A0D7A3J8_9AGAR|nr:hypothetical protein FISHEDRAFT_76981 [Fistulina hepatica ATCC 64428]
MDSSVDSARVTQRYPRFDAQYDPPQCSKLSTRRFSMASCTDTDAAMRRFKHIAMLASLTAWAMRERYECMHAFPTTGKRFRRADPAQPLLDTLCISFGMNSFIYEEMPGLYARDEDDPYSDEPARDPFVVPHIVITLSDEDDWDIRRVGDANRPPAFQNLIGGSLSVPMRCRYCTHGWWDCSCVSSGYFDVCPAIVEERQNRHFQRAEAGLSGESDTEDEDGDSGPDLPDSESDNDMEDYFVWYAAQESVPYEKMPEQLHKSTSRSSFVMLPGDDVSWILDIDNQPPFVDSDDEEYDKEGHYESDCDDEIAKPGCPGASSSDLESDDSSDSLPGTPSEFHPMPTPFIRSGSRRMGVGLMLKTDMGPSIICADASSFPNPPKSPVLSSWAEDEDLPSADEFFADWRH